MIAYICARLGHQRAQGEWTYVPATKGWEYRCMCGERVLNQWGAVSTR